VSDSRVPISDPRLKNRDAATVLTPPGAAAIAVVRIAGPGVAGFLAKHFSRRAAELRCVHGELKDGDGAVIDDPVVVLSAGGDFADINLHGGPWVVASTLELLRHGGFEVIEAEPGAPLPVETLEGDTLLEREVMAYLPLARTEQAMRMLLAQPQNWRTFAGSNPLPDAVRRVLGDDCLSKMLHPPRVAIVGAPNVGKSTLANQLFAQQRSITADVPGTTRDWVGEIANLDGLAVLLVDTPGVRETSDAIEREAIERSVAVVRAADLVVLVGDVSRGEDAQYRLLGAAHPDALLVLNKQDLPHPVTPGGDSAATVATVATVATTGAGVDELRRAIRQRLGCADLDPTRPRAWTQRQRDLILRGDLAAVATT